MTIIIKVFHDIILQALTKILQLVRQDLDRERRSKNGLDTLANAMHHHASGLKHDDSHKNVYEKLHHVSLKHNYYLIPIHCPYRDLPGGGRRTHLSTIRGIFDCKLQLDLPFSETNNIQDDSLSKFTQFFFV